jgi:hypothetical protein
MKAVKSYRLIEMYMIEKRVDVVLYQENALFQPRVQHLAWFISKE